MLQIDDTIISLDLIEKNFVCNLTACHGACCVEGDSGAPLTIDEISILEEVYPKIEPYLTDKSKKLIAEKGVFEIDTENDTVTPLINNKECAYLIYENNIAICGIEKAYNDKKINFRKPISCFLYPVRIKEYKNFTAINYDKWSICEPARVLGDKLGTPVYKFLKAPLIQRFGNEWFEKLEYAAKNYKNQKNK